MKQKMSKYEWKIEVNGRTHQVRYVTGLKVPYEMKGIFVDNHKVAQPLEKDFGLNRVRHEFTVGTEKIILQGYGTSYDLIQNGYYVKHKIPADHKRFDWSSILSLILALLSFAVLPVFGMDARIILLAAVSCIANLYLSFSPFYMGWKRLLRNAICLIALWGLCFWFSM